MFVAGLPKSGTTWLEMMLCDLTGYKTLMLPDATRHELRFGGSHDFELPIRPLRRLRGCPAVMKLHACGSQHNVDLLRSLDLKYVVLFRDLRDVAVSHLHYVRKTPWHPEYPVYASLDFEGGLRHFAETLLRDFVSWVRTWRSHCDPEFGLVCTYENLTKDTVEVLESIVEHLRFRTSREAIRRVVEKNDFSRLSGGRRSGEEDRQSFFRKGTPGDWVNHFTPSVKKRFKEVAGDFFIDLGYETDSDW